MGYSIINPPDEKFPNLRLLATKLKRRNVTPPYFGIVKNFKLLDQLKYEFDWLAGKPVGGRAVAVDVRQHARPLRRKGRLE